VLGVPPRFEITLPVPRLMGPPGQILAVFIAARHEAMRLAFRA
jgi:hypothetical protein